MPKVLILGSFPSVLSLEKEEYYANPRNRFWAVMGELLGISRTLPYPERIQSLEVCGIALWDVIATCIREGSADGAIREPEPNDIPGFLRVHHSVRLVVLNGSTAGRLFRSAWPDGFPAGLRFVVMPSTSPANARYRLPDLVNRWKVILATLEPPDGDRPPGIPLFSFHPAASGLTPRRCSHPQKAVRQGREGYEPEHG